jgi:hypothetical protein
MENMKIGLIDSGQNLLGDFCEHDNKIRGPSDEGINFFILWKFSNFSWKTLQLEVN